MTLQTIDAFARIPRAPAWVLIMAMAGCDLVSPSADEPSRTELGDAEAIWYASGVTEYELAVERYCFCPEVGEAVVTVRGGFDNVVRPTSGDPDVLDRDAYPDVPGLFAIVRDALARDAHFLRVAYHPTLGYPTEVTVDYRDEIADDEVGYRASLRVLSGGASLP